MGIEIETETDRQTKKELCERRDRDILTDNERVVGKQSKRQRQMDRQRNSGMGVQRDRDRYIDKERVVWELR